MASKLSKIRIYGCLSNIYLTPKDFTRTEAKEFIEEWQEHIVDIDDLRLMLPTDKVVVGWGTKPVEIVKLIEAAEFEIGDLPLNLV